MTNYGFKKKKDMVKLVRSLNKDLASYVTNNVEAEYESHPEVVCGPTPSYKFRAGLRGSELSQYQFRLSFQPTNKNQYELVLQVLKEDLEVGRMGSHTNSIDLSELCAKIIEQDLLNREMNRSGPQEPYSYPGGW